MKTRLSYCRCGCGELTTISPSTDRRHGYVAGLPRTFIKGHRITKPETWIEEDRGYATPCWIWLGAMSKDYGWSSKRRMNAHRAQWIDQRGPIPEGMHIHHLCGVSTCVRISHMTLETRSEHRRLTPQARRPRKKITDSQAKEIAESSESLGQIAKQYGISKSYARVLRKATGAPPRLSKPKKVFSAWKLGSPGRPKRGRISTSDYLIEDRGFSSKCWIWKGRNPASSEYGKIRLPDGRPGQAHIASYEQFVGPIADDLHLDHLCQVKRCINPQHLEPITPGDNVRRGGQAKLNWEIVHAIRASDEPNGVLAKRYGVHTESIRFVRIGRTWREN